MTRYVPKAKCPKCGRAPSVRFSEEEVARARRELQATRIVEVRCGRDRGRGRPLRCGTRYWIRAKDIAFATPEAEAASSGRANGDYPPGFPERGKVVLREAGLSVDDLERIEDWQSIPGVGPATEREMKAAMGRDLREP